MCVRFIARVLVGLVYWVVVNLCVCMLLCVCVRVCVFVVESVCDGWLVRLCAWLCGWLFVCVCGCVFV